MSRTWSNDYSALINLSNYDSNNPIFLADGTKVERAWSMGNAAVYAQVLWRPAGGVDFEVVTNSIGQSIFPFVEPGFYDGGFAIITNLSGGAVAELYVRAWRDGGTWGEAITNVFGFVGQSPVWSNGTGTTCHPGECVPSPARLSMPSFTMYPVPQAGRHGVVIPPVPFSAHWAVTPAHIRLSWRDLGPDYVYTVEKRNIHATNWVSAGGMAWPALVHTWTIARAEATNEIYRVKAERRL